MGRSPLEGVQNLTKHRSKDARRDGREYRIVEFVVHRKMQQGVILIPRLEAPQGAEIPQRPIDSVDADLAADQSPVVRLAYLISNAENPTVIRDTMMVLPGFSVVRDNSLTSRQ